MAEIIAKGTSGFVGRTRRTFCRAASLDIEQALEMARNVPVMMGGLPQV